MLFTALWPPAFFACLVMGRYDSICLLFILLALCRWMQGDMLRFSLWIGVGPPVIFPAFAGIAPAFVGQKRLIPLIKYSLLSLWLTVPLTLIYLGRDGDIGFSTA